MFVLFVLFVLLSFLYAFLFFVLDFTKSNFITNSPLPHTQVPSYRSKTPNKNPHKPTFQFFSPFFYSKLAHKGKEGVTKWVKDSKSLFLADFLFFPVNQALHWSLIVVGNPKRALNEEGEEEEERGRGGGGLVGKIEYLDSLGNRDRSTCQMFAGVFCCWCSFLFLTALFGRIKKYLEEEWKNVYPEKGVIDYVTFFLSCCALCLFSFLIFFFPENYFS